LNMMGPVTIYMNGAAPQTPMPYQTGTLRRDDMFGGHAA
jgi:hypothetical protein